MITPNEYYAKWLETFASAIPPQKIKKYVRSTGNYIWHVFSWELLSKDHYLTGNAAKEAFDEADKDGVQYIEWFANHLTHDITWKMLINALDFVDKKQLRRYN